ncbi:MAG: hypothetical protein WCT04_13905 [Planctomycetota bacterium]
MYGRKKIIFVHGCFWHQHSCARGTIPSSRVEFWQAKLAANKQRDKRNLRKLVKLGWKVLTIWECKTLNSDRLTKRLRLFMES